MTVVEIFVGGRVGYLSNPIIPHQIIWRHFRDRASLENWGGGEGSTEGGWSTAVQKWDPKTEPDFQFPVQEPDKNDEYCKIETGLENITVTMAANLPSLVVSPVAQAGKGIVGEGVWSVGHVAQVAVVAVDWTGTDHRSKKHLWIETRVVKASF